ncbi:MAG: hypothetical protein P4N24_19175 [Acidobacteriota bacterium]|nr:hypothetical protein [Acidobacteriota bacterium]
MPMTRREFLAVAAAAGVASPALTGQGSSPSLLDLAATPILIEFPGQPVRTLRPGAPRRSMGSLWADFPKAGPLAIRQVLREIGPNLVERSIEVYADADATFNIELPYELPAADSFYSWHNKVTARLALVQDVNEKGKPTAGDATQLLPFAGASEKGNLTGAFSDCPAFWENRAEQIIDPAAHRISLRTGDGTSAHLVSTIPGDSSGYYHGELDGWQHIGIGQLRRFRTWLFSAPAPNLYSVQLAVHHAIASALRPGDSDLNGILRNTSYFLVRRNLFRPESRYIIISGVTYGWKEWVSDMAMAGLGLEDPEILAESVRGIFWNRCNYEDNAQWYLIISALIARAGYHPDVALCRRSLEFILDNEKNGAYIPPIAAGNSAREPQGWKSYMDLFYYADGDSPTSNQGFHCGALMAARELSLGVEESTVQRACHAYADMFNSAGGYFPTSVLRPEVFGGDALYGEAISFAAFGRKSLPDELVLRHCRYAIKTQSPYGIRVVAKANGDLLEANQYGTGNPHGLPPEKAGAYVQGGSWFFCDAGAWLSGLAHGLEPATVDSLLIRRIREELAHVPAFNESINTRTGEPHGNILYSANSVYIWLRARIRERLGITGADPVDAAITTYLAERARSADL